MILECQNEGCQSGKSFEIDEKQVEWFEERGLTLPKSCPECRIWKRENDRDEVATCKVCNSKKVITGRQKIGFHRYKGVWELPTLCRLCELHPERGEKYAKDKQEKNRIRDIYRGPEESRSRQKHWRDPLARQEKILDLQTEVEPLQVLSDVGAYEKIFDKEHGNALEHIVGAKHGQELMQTYGVSDKQGVLNMLKLVAKSSDPERVYEFVQNDGRIVKYDRKYKVMMIILENSNPPPQDRILTAYPTSEGYLVTKISGGRWKPQKGKVV